MIYLYDHFLNFFLMTFRVHIGGIIALIEGLCIKLAYGELYPSLGILVIIIYSNLLNR